jgi:hypothetical protein
MLAGASDSLSLGNSAKKKLFVFKAVQLSSLRNPLLKKRFAFGRPISCWCGYNWNRCQDDYETQVFFFSETDEVEVQVCEILNFLEASKPALQGFGGASSHELSRLAGYVK